MSDPLSLSIAACQLFNAQNTTTSTHPWQWPLDFWNTPLPSTGGQAANFLSMFRDSWGGLEHHLARFNFVNPPTSLEAHKPQDVILHYHMRLLSASSFSDETPTLKLDRVTGSIRHPSANKTLFVRESRLSVAIRTTCDLDLPVFSLVALADTHRYQGSFNSYSLGRLHNSERWMELGIRPSIRSTGVAAFAFRIHTMCSFWATEWADLLNELDSQLTVTVNLQIIAWPSRL